MARSRATRIFFPWEHRGGVLRRLGLNRLRPFLVLALLGSLTIWVGLRERRQAGERRTRALLGQYRAAIDAHLAEHDGKCPKSLALLRESAGIEPLAVDAWSQPFRFLCPWEAGTEPYLLSSDGPDGLPGGLDRIE